MKKKKIIIGSIILCLLLAVTIGLTILKNTYPKTKPTKNKEENEEIQYNTNSGVTAEKTINNLLFSDIEFSFDGTTSLLTYKITNKSKENISLENYEIIIKDKSDNIIAIVVPSATEEIEPNETIETGNTIDIDLSEAYTLDLKTITE